MPEAEVNCSFGCFKVSLKWDFKKTKKNLDIKVKYYLKWVPDARQGKGLGETPQPPGHPDALTPGRADCVILKCFRLRPDGCVKRDHTHTQTNTYSQFGVGLQLLHTNNSCEPDALQNFSLKHMHTNAHCSRSLLVLFSWEGQRFLHLIPDIQ